MAERLIKQIPLKFDKHNKIPIIVGGLAFSDYLCSEPKNYLSLKGQEIILMQKVSFQDIIKLIDFSISRNEK